MPEQLTDASAVLKTTFIGDVAPLEQSSARASEIVSRTATQINSALASASGFESFAQSAQSSAQVAAQSFSIIGQSSQIAASNIAGVGPAAQQAGQQVAAGMGAAGIAAQQAGAGIDGFGQSTLGAQGAASALQAQVAQNVSQMNALGVQIAQNRVELASLASQINASKDSAGKATQQTAALKAQYQSLALETRTLTAQKSLLNAQTNQLAGSTQAGAAAQAIAGQSLEKTSGFMRVLSGLMTTQTTQISSQGTAWAGWDAAVQSVVRSLGGISVLFSILASLGGILLAKLISSKKSTEELTQVNKELMESDIALANAFQILAGSVGNGNQAIEKQLETHRALLGANLDAAILRYIEAYNSYAPVVERAAQAENELKEVTAISNRLKEQGIDVTRISATELNQMLASMEKVNYAGALQIEQDLIAIRAFNEKQQAIGQVTDAHGKEEEKVKQATQTLALFAAQSGKTTDEILKMAEAARANANALVHLEGRMNSTAAAVGRLADAQARLAARVPDFDVEATAKGVDDLFRQAAEGIEVARKKYDQWGEVVIVNEKNLEKTRKAAEKYAAANAVGATQTERQKNATVLYNQKLSELTGKYGEIGSATNRALGGQKEIDKTLKVFSDTTKKAGGGARATGAAFNEFASDSLGLAKAIEITKSKLGDPDLFAPVSKSARAAMRETKAAFTEAAEAVEDFFTARGAKVDVSIERLAKLAPQIGKPLLDASEAFRNLRTAVEDLNFERAAAGLSVFDDAIKIVGNEVRISAGAFEHFNPEVKKSIDVLKQYGLTVTAVLPELANKNNILVEIIKRTSDKNEEILDRMATVTEQQTARQIMSWDRLAKSLPVAQFHQQLQTIREDIEAALVSEGTARKLAIHSEIESAISLFERWGTIIGKTGDELEKFVTEKVKESLSQVPGITQGELNHTIEIWKRELNKLPGIWERVFGQLPSQTKKALGNVLKLIEKLPGEMGDHLRDALDEVERWVDFVDSALAVLHDIFPEIPESLEAALQKMVDVFRGNGQTAVDVTAEQAQAILDEIKLMASDMEAVFTDDMGNVLFTGADVMRDGMDQIASAAEQGATKVVQVVSQMISGLSLLMSGRRQGGLGGAISGAIGGFKIGSIFGPIGGIIGGALGGLFGLFGGKSELEKAQEAAQLQEAKDRIKLSQQAVLQSVEETKQSLLETASKATQLLKDIGLHIDIPKDVFDAWFKDLDELMRRLAARMEAWSKEHSEELKAAAEEMGVVAEAAAAIAVALAAIGQSFRVSDAQIDALVASWEYLLTALADMEERLANETERHAKKLARRTEVVPDYVAQTADAIRAIADLPTITPEQVAKFKDAAIEILTTVAEIFEEVNRFQLRVTGQSAEMALPILEFTSGLSETLRAAVEQPIPGESDWANLKKGAEAAFDFVFALFEELQAEELTRAASLAATSNPIVEFVNNLFGAFRTGGEIGMLPQLNFEQIKAQAKGLLKAVIDLAEEISAEAAAQGSTLSEAAREIPSFVADLASGIKSASEITGIHLDVANLKQQGKALIGAVVELAAELDTEGVEAARKLAESGLVITEFASSLAASMTALSEGARAGDYYIRVAVEAYRSMVNQFAMLREQISPEIMAAAEEVARRGAGIFTNIQTIGNALSSTAQIQIAQPTALIQAMRTWVDGLSSVRDEMQQGYDVSAEILLLSEGIEANLSQAAANLAASARTLGSSVSLTGGAGLSPPTFISPQPTGSSITVQVDARGAVIDEAKLTDKILSGLTQLERGQRIVRVTK